MQAVTENKAKVCNVILMGLTLCRLTLSTQRRHHNCLQTFLCRHHSWKGNDMLKGGSGDVHVHELICNCLVGSGWCQSIPIPNCPRPKMSRRTLCQTARQSVMKSQCCMRTDGRKRGTSIVHE